MNREGEVWVFAEQEGGVLNDVSLELCGKARELGDTLGVKVAAVLPGSEIKGLGRRLIAHGVDRVLKAKTTAEVDAVLDTLRERPASVDPLFTQAVERVSRVMHEFDTNAVEEVFSEGLLNVMEEPEFERSERLRRVFNVLQDRAYLGELVQKQGVALLRGQVEGVVVGPLHRQHLGAGGEGLGVGCEVGEEVEAALGRGHVQARLAQACRKSLGIFWVFELIVHIF